MLEDDPDDRFITQSTLKELGLDIDISYIGSSTELFDRLQGPEKPNVIIIDFNSTPENALDVLRRLKADKDLKGIPTVVLGDMGSGRYVKDCYSLGASSCIQKPASSDLTNKKIKTFFEYWLHIAEA